VGQKNRIFLFLILFIALALSTLASAQSDLPTGLQKIIDFNNQSTADFAVKVSFFIAFVAGILGILSPCILPFLPAYFSYTFKEKKNITKMTLVFFLGFSLVFVTMGVIAGFIGEQTLSVIQTGWLVAIAGILMIILGIIALRGKKVCSYLNVCSRFNNDIPGTFLFGIFFAVGWTACLGPILAGILGIGAILGNIWYSALLLFFYSLGNLVPLFILSMLYDKFNLSQSKFIKGKIFEFSIAKKKYYIHSTNLISGILFLAIGAILLLYKGTTVFNTWDIFGTKSYFYSIQRQLIGWEYANILGIISFILFILIIGLFLWKHKKAR
jgi:cytochrome c biogenesis protein CcdA